MANEVDPFPEFQGTARLFPLPNLVFFPHALQPLHIFEMRYRTLLADALADDRIIALVLLQPGWEQNYDSKPAIHQIACLGRIIGDQLLPDGRSNILLRGLTRVRIQSECEDEKPYRSAHAEILYDIDDVPLPKLMRLRQEMETKIIPKFGDSVLAKHLHDLFHGEMSLGALCDVLTFALPFPIMEKQKILEELHISIRAQLLLSNFASVLDQVYMPAPVVPRKYPPEFSAN